MRRLSQTILTMCFILLLSACNIQPEDLNLATFPEAPRNLTLEVKSSSEIELNWSRPSDDGGKPISGYRIYRRGPSESRFQIIVSNTNSTQTSYLDSSLLGGNLYEYRVAAVNEVSSGRFSNNVSERTLRTHPSIPLNVTTHSLGSGGAIIVDWDEPLNDGGYNITHYQIERRDLDDVDPDFHVIVEAYTESQLSYTDSEVEPLSNYEYRVTAVNTLNSDDPLSGEPSEIVFTRSTCPSNYVLVADRILDEDEHYSEEHFCVMEFEGRYFESSGERFFTYAENSPIWTEISFEDAKDVCVDQGSSSRFGLINNSEWMRIARYLESVSQNILVNDDQDCLKQGNVKRPASSCSYNASGLATGTKISRDSRSELVLPNGRSIWDFSGNAWQWVDWDGDDFTCTDAINEIDIVDLVSQPNSGCGLNPDDYLPDSISSLQGSGIFFSEEDMGGGFQSIRGGSYEVDNSLTGVFSLSFIDPSAEYEDVGFRCVYR